MRLSDLCTAEGWHLLADGDVGTLGFVETPLAGRLTFAMDRANLERAAAGVGIAAILTTPALAEEAARAGAAIGLAASADPRLAFARAHNRLAAAGFYGAPAASVVGPSADVHPTAHIDAVGVNIGAGCRIGPKAIVLAGTTLHDGVHVMAGAVLGGAGFQVMRGDALVDLVHIGGLVVGARSVVMANAVLARAVFLTETRLGADCRIGNNAFVSHNCQIGDRCLIGHGSVVAGSCVVESDVTLGPGVVVIDRRVIGRGAAVTAGATVVRDVPAGARVSGPPARGPLGG